MTVRARDRILAFLRERSRVPKKSKTFWGVPAFLFALLLVPLAYSNILHSPFVLDDNLIELMKKPKDIPIFHIGFRQITNLSFAMNNLTGWGLAGYHSVNILIHMITSALVYYLFRLTVSFPSLQGLTMAMRRLIPLFGASLFAIHPIQTSAVTYISQRAALLAAFFCLCSLIFYIKGVLSDNRKLSFLAFYPLSLISLLFGILSKENAAIFPLVILLYDLFFLSSFRWRSLLARMLPIAGLFVFIGLIAIVKFTALKTLKEILSLYSDSTSPIPFKSWTAIDVFWTPLQHLLTELRVVSRYISIFILPLPSRLVFDFGPNYPVSSGLFRPATTFLSLLFLVGLVAVSVRYAKRYPLASFGIIFYLISISLESFIAVGADLYFEHRNYLPGVGIFLSISFIASSLLLRVQDKRAWYLLMLIPLMFAFLTYDRNKAWQSVESIWQDTMNKVPDNKRAMVSLGYVYVSMGKYQEASDILTKALDMHLPRRSFDFIAYSKLIEVYAIKGMTKEMSDATRAMIGLSADTSLITLPPDTVLFFTGNAYFWQGDLKRSKEYLQKALPHIHNTSQLFSAHLLLGQIELRSGSYQQAAYHLESARSLQPDNPAPLLHLGDLSYLQNDPKRAEWFYLQAIDMDNKYLQAYMQLGQIYIAQNKNAQAIEILKKAYRYYPDDYSLNENLGNLSFSMGDLDSAIRYFSRAAEIEPTDPINHFNLGECYARKDDTARARTSFMRFLELAPDSEFHDTREAVRKWLKKQ